MNLFLNFMIFIMGTFFGSFFTLAVYRIPLKKDITHEHSFCPNCNHKLGFFDLVPIFSYLFLKGKCRYCGQKVRIRYLILEVLSGVVFLLAYLSLNIQNIFLYQPKVVSFIAFVFVYVTFVIIAGIDKEYRKINLSVVLFGEICQALYILYLYIIEQASMYRYSIYFAIFILLFLVTRIIQKKRERYGLQIAVLFSYCLLILDLKAIPYILVLNMILMLILHFKKSPKSKKITNMPLGFGVAFSTICYIIVENFIKFY